VHNRHLHIWLAPSFIIQSSSLLHYFHRLKNVAIQHVNKQDLPDKLIDRELQSRFVRETLSNTYKTNSIDVDQYANCIKDKVKEFKDFYDHKTQIRLPGIYLYSMFIIV